MNHGSVDAAAYAARTGCRGDEPMGRKGPCAETAIVWAIRDMLYTFAGRFAAARSGTACVFPASGLRSV